MNGSGCETATSSDHASGSGCETYAADGDPESETASVSNTGVSENCVSTLTLNG